MRQASAACSRDGLRMDQGAQGHERHKRRAWHATSSHPRRRPAERSRPSQAHCTFPKARSRPERPCGEGGLRSVPLTTERGRHRAAGPAAIRSVSCRMGRRGAVHRHVAPCHVRQQGAPDRTGQCRRGDVKPAASRANGAVEAETGGGGDHEDTPSRFRTPSRSSRARPRRRSGRAPAPQPSPRHVRAHARRRQCRSHRRWRAG